MLDFFTEFPEISRSDIRDIKTSIDNAFRTFSRNYGESIENFFDPLLWFLIWIEKLLLNTPWPIIILIIALLYGPRLNLFHGQKLMNRLICCY